ncbi:MAG: hypothetical protein ACOC58_01890, partial [Chloroflexota bacterium]
LNTPLRPCAVAPLGQPEMAAIRAHFGGLNAVDVYQSQSVEVRPLDMVATQRRRPTSGKGCGT